MKRTTKKKREPGSLNRDGYAALVAKWRRETAVWRRNLGAAIDEGSRSEIRIIVRMLEYCAGELEKKSARHNKESSEPARTKL